jgi:hypothetical protein
MHWVTLTSQNYLELHLSQVMYLLHIWSISYEMWTSNIMIYEEMLKLGTFIYALSDYELSKLTLRDLGPQTLVSKNNCYQQHQFLIRGFGDMGWTAGQTVHSICIYMNLLHLKWFHISRFAYKSVGIFKVNLEVFEIDSPISRYHFSPELVKNFRSIFCCLYWRQIKISWQKTSIFNIFAQ